VPRLSLLAAFATLLAACGTPSPGVSDDPILRMLSPTEPIARRRDAMDTAWNAAEQGEYELRPTREALKTIAWSPSAPEELRVRAVQKLASDESPEGRADNLEMARLMLPRERSRGLVTAWCREAVEQRWTELAPALVRALSRDVPGLSFEQRSEVQALRQLFPSEDLATIAFGVFMQPATDAGPYGVDWDERTRADAWAVLARLDPDASRRRALLAATDADDADAMLSALQAALHDLSLVPTTAEELRWLVMLREPAHRAWWEEAVRAATSAGFVDDSSSLALRHLSALVDASRHASDRLAMDADALRTEADARFASRDTRSRDDLFDSLSRARRQTFAPQRDAFSRADLLTMLAVDDAVRAPTVVEQLFRQASLDNGDTSTEYGGILERTSGAEPVYRALLYPPRPSQRTGDRRFVASEEMIRAGATALAEYHFHAQKWKNAEYAGPSDEDLRYAASSGRTCIVLTTLDRDRIGVDLYQPDGRIIDMGEIARATSRAGSR
jgi:hypothetical protein